MRNRATTPLKKPVLRQSWSKYNLYNLNRLLNPKIVGKNHFQQKWIAKSVTRAYHGEQVSEGYWERMFSPRIRSVVPMDPWKLAADDGSSMAMGRGSGERPDDREAERKQKQEEDSRYLTPFAQMAYAPLERRLDVALFRSMFASSTRQARQFVLHGSVTVNGKKMKFPGYLLNPGDMFQVDPDRVMYATGAPKEKFERRQTRVARKYGKKDGAEAAEATEEGAAAEAKEEKEPETEEKANETDDPRETLKALLAQAKNILSSNKDVLPAKRKQELRGFQASVRRVLSRAGSSTIATDSLEEQFSQLTLLLKAKAAEQPEAKKLKGIKNEQSKETSDAESKEPVPQTQGESRPSDALTDAFKQATENPSQEVDTSELSEEEFDVLKRALVQMRDNPIDSSKPYSTPWRPRDYMSPFAMIPRYLEVNHNICAGVYLRHPVARPGSAEVPTPYGKEVGTSAFTWYLRRR